MSNRLCRLAAAGIRSVLPGGGRTGVLLACLAGTLGAGCGSDETMGSAEYIRFRYTVTPASIPEQQVDLAIPAGSLTCGREAKQLRIRALSGLTSLSISLDAAGTSPRQPALTANAQTTGVARVDVNVPTSLDANQMPATPVNFSTTTVGNVFECTLSLLGADPFASFDGSFTCTSSSTSSGRRLSITDGTYHAVPCPGT